MMQPVVAWLNLRKSSQEIKSSQQHTSSRSKYLALFFAFHFYLLIALVRNTKVLMALTELYRDLFLRLVTPQGRQLDCPVSIREIQSLLNYSIFPLISSVGSEVSFEASKKQSKRVFVDPTTLMTQWI